MSYEQADHEAQLERWREDSPEKPEVERDVLDKLLEEAYKQALIRDIEERNRRIKQAQSSWANTQLFLDAMKGRAL